MVARPTITKWLLGGILLAVLSLPATFSFLIGCMSPGTRDLAIYRVDVALLAEELLKLSSNITLTKSDLVNPQLPNYWFFGTSGICDFYTDSARLTAQGETRCRRAFPPSQSILSVVEESIGSGSSFNGTDQENSKVITAVISAWSETLDGITSPDFRDKASKATAESKASAALAVLSLIFDFLSFGSAPFMEERAGRKVLYVAALFSSVMAVAAGVCAVLAMNDGMHGITSGVGNVSGSLVFLFIGAVLKVPAVLLLSPRPPRLSKEEIGDWGERFIYEWLHNYLPDLSVQHWSSKAHPDEQWKFADFTYPDHGGYMLQALRGVGVPVMTGWSERTTYHIEVKSTQQDCNGVPFFVSPNQIKMMQRYNDNPNEAYIVARVFHVGRRKMGVRFFPRPWHLKDLGDLEFGVPTEKGDTPVYIRR